MTYFITPQLYTISLNTQWHEFFMISIGATTIKIPIKSKKTVLLRNLETILATKLTKLSLALEPQIRYIHIFGFQFYCQLFTKLIHELLLKLEVN